MTLKEYIKEREYRPEFKKEFTLYQPAIECVRILIDAQIEQNLSMKCNPYLQSEKLWQLNSNAVVME